LFIGLSHAYGYNSSPSDIRGHEMNLPLTQPQYGEYSCIYKYGPVLLHGI